MSWVLVTMILVPAAAAGITALLPHGSDELARRLPTARLLYWT